VTVQVDPDWLLTPERAAVHLPTATAVVADLHLGYGQARRRRGEAVPRVRVAEALAPLRPALARHRVRRLVIAGDLFEDSWCPALTAELLDWLAGVGAELAGLVPGNHDRGLEADAPLPLFREGVQLGRWRVLHGDGPLPPGPVVHGHFHPWLRWGSVTAPCYLVGKGSLVLPAFSRDARGVDVLRRRCWDGRHCWAIAGEEVLDLGPVETLRRLRKSAPV
jgi:uncharacterized protein